MNRITLKIEPAKINSIQEDSKRHSARIRAIGEIALAICDRMNNLQESKEKFPGGIADIAHVLEEIEEVAHWCGIDLINR